jgi:hypothetical protein
MVSPPYSHPVGGLPPVSYGIRPLASIARTVLRWTSGILETVTARPERCSLARWLGSVRRNRSAMGEGRGTLVRTITVQRCCRFRGHLLNLGAIGTALSPRFLFRGTGNPAGCCDWKPDWCPGRSLPRRRPHNINGEDLRIGAVDRGLVVEEPVPIAVSSRDRAARGQGGRSRGRPPRRRPGRHRRYQRRRGWCRRRPSHHRRTAHPQHDRPARLGPGVGRPARPERQRSTAAPWRDGLLSPCSMVVVSPPRRLVSTRRLVSSDSSRTG